MIQIYNKNAYKVFRIPSNKHAFEICPSCSFSTFFGAISATGAMLIGGIGATGGIGGIGATEDIEEPDDVFACIADCAVQDVNRLISM